VARGCARASIGTIGSTSLPIDGDPGIEETAGA
jgi:hypothetical protein